MDMAMNNRSRLVAAFELSALQGGCMPLGIDPANEAPIDFTSKIKYEGHT
jgi:hypothetical protein